MLAQMHMPSSQYVTFLAPRRVRPRRISRSQMRRRRAARRYDLGKQKAATRYTHAGARARHPVYNKVVAHIAPCVSLFLLLCVPIVRIELRREFHAHTYTRTHTRAP